MYTNGHIYKHGMSRKKNCNRKRDREREKERERERERVIDLHICTLEHSCVPIATNTAPQNKVTQVALPSTIVLREDPHPCRLTSFTPERLREAAAAHTASLILTHVPRLSSTFSGLFNSCLPGSASAEFPGSSPS